MKHVTASPELVALIARQRRERPELDHAPDWVMPVAAPSPGAKPVRCKRRYMDWHSKAYQTAAELKRRFKGQAEEIDAALEKEIETGPDFMHWHRGSLFVAPPKNNTDRNHIARIWFVAQMIERKSWACKKKGKHGGTLGTVAIELLRVLLYVIKKTDGRLYPSYETLAVLSRKSKQAVVTAMQVLERMGFVTIHKRIKRVQTPFGQRVVQDSNAYEFHLPTKGIGRLAMAIFCPPSSGSTKSDATKTSYTNREQASTVSARGEVEKGQPTKEADRWWLDPPLATGNGGWR
jgi:hypothetical protein